MKNEEWVLLLDGIFAAHGKSTPHARISGKWFEHVYDIPIGPAQDIARSLEQTARLEANVGLQFLLAWRAWRIAHPERCAQEPQKVYGCKNCHGGFIWWSRFTPSGHGVVGASLCKCVSADGTTPEVLKSRGRGLGSPWQVQAWALEHNRQKSGFYAKYGQGKTYNVANLVQSYRTVELGQEEIALMVGE